MNMNKYIATFYSHYGALTFYKALSKADITAKLMPVPRSLSSSCGTCVEYCTEKTIDFFNEEIESVYLYENNAYSCIKEY